MKQKINRTLLVILTLVLGSSALGVRSIQAEEKPQAVLNGRGYLEPTSVDSQIDTTAVVISAVFSEHKGRLMAYTMTNGGYFNALDVELDEVIFSKHVEGVSQVWAHTVDSNGIIYLGALGPKNDGQLYRYVPESENLEYLGTPLPGHQFWSITTDEHGNVYIGTHKEHEAAVVKYDVSKEEFIHLGLAAPGKKMGYVRSIAYHDGSLYLGTGIDARLIKMNPDTGDTIDITANAYDIIDKKSDKNDIKHIYNLDVAGDYLFARFDNDGENALLFYNLKEQKWSDKKLAKNHDGGSDDYGVFSWDQLAFNGTKTYITYERKLHEIDIETLEHRQVGNSFLGHRGGAVWDFGKGNEFVSLERIGTMAHFNLETGNSHRTENVLKGTPLLLHNLGKDSEGNLYVSSYPGGPKGLQVNLKEGTKREYRQMQAEGMAAGEEHTMYFGLYGGAVIQAMDTQSLKQETLFNLKDEYQQDRPYIMKYEDDLLMIGTIPDYKVLGGVLALYNPKTQEKNVYPNVVKNQSIVGLAKYGNLIFGSTTTKGGLDADPTQQAEKPVIFVWDIEKQEKIQEITLPFSEISKTPMISGLTFDQDGQLWGAVDGILFTMDPETLMFTKHLNIYPDISNRGMWRPVHIEFGEDGFVYTDLGGRLTVVDPSTWEHTRILTPKEVDFMTLSHDGDGNEAIYFLQNSPTAIETVKIIDVDPFDVVDETMVAQVILPIENHNFEEEAVKQKAVEGLTDKDVDLRIISGWSSLFDAITENVGFEITDEKAFEGNKSLKLFDRSDKETVFVKSNPIPVQPDLNYRLNTQLFLLDGQNTVFIRFFDQDGISVMNDVEGVSLKHIRNGYGLWQEVSVGYRAPKEAAYAQLHFGSSNYFQTEGAFYDGIEGFEEREVVILKTKVLMHYLDKAERFVANQSKTRTNLNLKALVDEIESVKLMIEQIQSEQDAMKTGISQEAFQERISQEDVDAAVASLKMTVDTLKPVEPDEGEKPIETPVDNPTEQPNEKPIGYPAESPTTPSIIEPSQKVPVQGDVQKPMEIEETVFDKHNVLNQNLPSTGVQKYSVVPLSAMLLFAGSILFKKRD